MIKDYVIVYKTILKANSKDFPGGDTNDLPKDYLDQNEFDQYRITYLDSLKKAGLEFEIVNLINNFTFY